ncbi:BrnT family toxin [Alkalimarinus coralli]|uniref:BrnT family toxin n=1 Tax=Alkalimarinus coralli TaxID=2935863 RepID=UPI00202B906A|nr:BrnT family toxin [Alkalimarinus coralli]
MDHLNFEWDANKNASNIKKHGVSFDEAKTVFTDEYARLINDPDHSEDEDRFILLGASIDSKLLVVCHCVREGESIRIISARKADKQEHKVYEGYRHARSL